MDTTSYTKKNTEEFILEAIEQASVPSPIHGKFEWENGDPQVTLRISWMPNCGYLIDAKGLQNCCVPVWVGYQTGYKLMTKKQLSEYIEGIYRRDYRWVFRDTPGIELLP